MAKKFTGLASEPPMSYRSSEKNKDSKVSASGQDSRPRGPRSKISDQETLGAGLRPTHEKASLRMMDLKTSFGISMKKACWKMKKISVN